MPRVKKPAEAEAPLHVSQVDVCVAYKEIFGTRAGQVVLADLMRRFSFTRISTLVPGDIHTTIHHEGSRTVLVHIGRMLDADPAEMQEHTTEQ